MIWYYDTYLDSSCFKTKDKIQNILRKYFSFSKPNQCVCLLLMYNIKIATAWQKYFFLSKMCFTNHIASSNELMATR